MKLFDERYMRTHVAVRLGRVGQEGVGAARTSRDENVVSMFEGGTNLLLGRALRPRRSGCDDLWVKQCGNSHTGSFKDLGMTVLVSTVKQMIARRQADPRDRLRLDRRHLGGAGRLRRRRRASARWCILPRGKVSTAQLVQPLANGALVLAIDTDFDGCMAIVQALAEEEGVYLANSMNSLRLEGQKTVAIEIVQQFDWEVPDWVVIPGGNLGNVSALGAGFDDDARARASSTKLPRICVAQAEAANPLYRAYKTGFDKLRAGGRAKPTLASAIQIGNPVSVQQGDPRAAAVRRRGRAGVARAELADAAGARRSHRACSPARTPASRSPRWRSWSARGEIQQRDTRGGRSAPPTASSSPTSRSATTSGKLPGVPNPSTPTRRSCCPTTTPPSATPSAARSTSKLF